MYIYCLVPEGEAVGSDDVGHSTYVQYVEGTSEQAIFTNGQMYIFLNNFLIAIFIKKKNFRAYPVYTVGESGTMYQTGQTQYYAPSTNSYSQVSNISYNQN